MKIVEINSVNRGSTGTIMLGIAQAARKNGIIVYTYNAACKSRDKYIEGNFTIGYRYERLICSQINYFTGISGSLMWLGTKKFLTELDRIKPDIIHLHNLHDNYINLSMLFEYIKKNKIKTVWTLHDCWPFTGHCPYYDMVGCHLWEMECRNCPSYKEYPSTFFDNSNKMFKKKKNYFLDIPSMILVTPSVWLNGEIKKSFLKNYPVRVISNGIDIKTFSPKDSNFREKHNIGDRFLVLGCASIWSTRKGFDCFVNLSKMLDQRFAIAMIGNFSPEQEKICDENNIIHISTISSKESLAEVYSATDVFFNPTREEMFGLVNIEAEACGCPVIAFNSGGCPECIGDKSGFIVPRDDIQAAYEKIIWLYDNKDKIDKMSIRQWACKFDSRKMYNEYISLYKELAGD